MIRCGEGGGAQLGAIDEELSVQNTCPRIFLQLDLVKRMGRVNSSEKNGTHARTPAGYYCYLCGELDT